MLPTQNRDYLIDSIDDVETEANELSITAQDHNWLAYCAMGGHEHYNAADIAPQRGVNTPESYMAAA